MLRLILSLPQNYIALEVVGQQVLGASYPTLRYLTLHMLLPTTLPRPRKQQSDHT